MNSASDSDAEMDQEESSCIPSKSTEEDAVDFSFITDGDDEENILDDEDTDASDESSDDHLNSLLPKKDTLKNVENDTKLHPLAHLFDDPEITEPKPALNTKKTDKKIKQKPLSEKLYDGLTNKSKETLQRINKCKKDDEIDKLLAKSDILNSDPSEMFCIEPQLSKRKLKKLKKEERDKTKGDKWFGLPATEMTDEVKRDLELLKMRSVLDPKRFYKKNDLQVLPKYFQIGKIMDSPRDFYSHRLTKKERKKTLVDELMADAAFNKYNKNKYAEILKEKQKTHYKAWRQAKRLKKKK